MGSVKVTTGAASNFWNEGPRPEFEILVANLQLETPTATTESQSVVGDIIIEESLIVMTNLTRPLAGFFVLYRNSKISGLPQGVFHFPLFHAFQTGRQHIF